jgi:hypothetical protein
MESVQAINASLRAMRDGDKPILGSAMRVARNPPSAASDIHSFQDLAQRGQAHYEAEIYIAEFHVHNYASLAPSEQTRG